MGRKEDVIKIFPQSIRNLFGQSEWNLDELQEIRLRIHAPLLIVYQNEEFYVSKDGRISRTEDSAFIVTKNEIRETMEYVSNYSMYAYEEEIRQGFITIQGGHRVGLAGKIIMERDSIKSMKYISFINIRLSHQIKGCADPVMPYIRQGSEIYHTLIISPPRRGKTTLLRDVIRQLSDGDRVYRGMTVGVVDERSEIGACYMGIPQNELGIRTDILDCCPKVQGMLMLIRTMSPQVIAVDEIGSREDMEAMIHVMNCGCKLIATVHGSSIEDIRSKPILRKLLQERIFERYIVMNSQEQIGKIAEIFDCQGNPLYNRMEVTMC
ncbi:MAG: stage III sporulation protein AA [Lachnospiraceae bacterium]|nr:stage III sporulation protein AA [Lachnospiraceae bacterium]